MIVIRLRGGLGNQMFQYALGVALAKRLDTELKIDLTSLLKRKKETDDTVVRNFQLHIFNINASYLIKPQTINTLRKLRLNVIVQLLKGVKLFGVKTIKEQRFNFNKAIIENPIDNALYNGYWQSEYYFKDVAETVRAQFKFKHKLCSKASKLLDTIQQTNSVCVHIRRGDYATAKGFNLSDLSYFETAANVIAKNVHNPYFFIFSDEPKWCLKHVKLKHPSTVIDYNTKAIRFKQDLELMSKCNHFIMSASSFSWWAVWLRNNNEGIVIAPKDWFINNDKDVTDLIHPKWIRL